MPPLDSCSSLTLFPAGREVQQADHPSPGQAGIMESVPAKTAPCADTLYSKHEVWSPTQAATYDSYVKNDGLYRHDPFSWAPPLSTFPCKIRLQHHHSPEIFTGTL